MTIQFSVEFVGGPKDGECRSLYSLHRYFDFPYQSGQSIEEARTYKTADERYNTPLPNYKTLLYELRCDKSKPYYQFIGWKGSP